MTHLALERELFFRKSQAKHNRSERKVRLRPIKTLYIPEYQLISLQIASSGQSLYVMDPEAHKRSLCIQMVRSLSSIKAKEKRSDSIDIEKPFQSNRLIGSLTSIGVRKEKSKKHVLFVDIQIC